MNSNMFANTRSLTKFMFRRERIRIIAWIFSLAAVTLLVALAFTEMFPSDAERMGMAVTMKNPAMTAMVGPGYGLDNYTDGAMMAHEMLLFTIITVVIMNIFMVIRHTRRDEERGRLEMIRSLPAGKLSILGSTMILALIVNGILSLVTGLGLYALGIESMDFEGSMLYGTALGVSGILFAAFTALFSQLCASARGAMGYSLALMGLLYLMRASGDVNNETLACISPLGLILRTKVYVDNTWWPVFVIFTVTVVILILAFYLNSIRDIGQGFIPARKGRAYASGLLKTPFGLGFRLLRASFIAWGIGVFILGVSYGSIFGDMDSFLENIELFREALTKPGVSVTMQFVTMLMSVLAMLCAVPTVSMMLKLKSEESRNHTEHILTKPVSRNRLMGSYFIISMIGSVVMLFLSVFGLWYVGNTVTEESLSFVTFMKAGMVYLPATWIMVGLTVFFIGNISKLSGLVWAYLGYSFFTVYLGELLQMPEWTRRISPFGNIPKIPVDEFDAVPLIFESVIAVVLIVLGFIGYRKRDVNG